MKKFLSISFILSSVVASTLLPSEVLAQQHPPELCVNFDDAEHFNEYSRLTVSGWCLRSYAYHSSYSGNRIDVVTANTYTNDDSYGVFVFKSFSVNLGVTYYITVVDVSTSRNLFTFTTDSNLNINRDSIEGNAFLVDEFSLLIEEGVRQVLPIGLPISGNPFVIAASQPPNTCWVSDEIYVPIGVESPGFSDPAFITGETPGSRVNLRVGAGTEFDTSGYGLVGDYVEVIGQAFDNNCDTWAKVFFPTSEHEAWIHSRYIEMTYGRGWWD